MADEVIVMKEGRVVERGCTEDVFADPKDPYTRALMAAALGGADRRACRPSSCRLRTADDVAADGLDRERLRP